MIIAKSEKGLEHFKALFKAKSESEELEEKKAVPLKKWYHATCELTPQGEAFLAKITEKLPFIISEEVRAKVPNCTPKRGITQIEKIKKTEDWTVELFLQIFTGRTHQIRVHLSNHGLPILGDYLYGKEAEVPVQLTAYQLEFKDPAGELITISLL